MSWQVQEAKQRFSELVRSAHTEGPQIVTRHGEEIAVVMDIDEYRRLQGQRTDFKEYLRAGPSFDGLDLRPPLDLPRSIDWSAEV